MKETLSLFFVENAELAGDESFGGRRVLGSFDEIHLRIACAIVHQGENRDDGVDPVAFQQLGEGLDIGIVGNEQRNAQLFPLSVVGLNHSRISKMSS